MPTLNRSALDAGRGGAVGAKIELHVHLEGTVMVSTLLAIARRNDVALPVRTEEELEQLYHFTDFEHFIEVFTLATTVLRTADDFRQVVMEYVGQAAGHGAVYVEAIFSPGRAAALGTSWDTIFSGYCEGARQAEDEHGVIVRLTPEIYRGQPLDEACEVARQAVRFKDQGVVGLGLGGREARNPPETYRAAFEIAKDGGLGSVPHAGEVVGPASIRGALNALGADRIRHGVRAVEDPDLVAELAERGVVLDVCPTSNLRTGAVRSLDVHPLPQLMAAGVQCSVSTDDPAMFDTDLSREYDTVAHLGISLEQVYRAGVHGALCDGRIKERLLTYTPR